MRLLDRGGYTRWDEVMTQRAWWRNLPPAAGAFVMATGIISIGLHITGFEVISRITLGFAAAAWVLLAADFITRLLWNRSRWESEADTAPALTAVAASTVVGTRFSLLGWQPVAVVLLILATAVWPVLLTTVVRHWTTRMPGAAFLVCVSTQGLAVLATTLAAAGVRAWLAAAALLFFILGLLLYIAAFTHFDVRQIWRGAGDHWVSAGALAISALAGSKLVAWHAWTGTLHTALQVTTWILLALTLAGYVLLVAAEFVRFRPGYDIRRWATVFPLGMTAVAVLSCGVALDVPPMHNLGKLLLAVAVAVWLLVLIELGVTRTATAQR